MVPKQKQKQIEYSKNQHNQRKNKIRQEGNRCYIVIFMRLFIWFSKWMFLGFGHTTHTTRKLACLQKDCWSGEPEAFLIIIIFGFSIRRLRAGHLLIIIISLRLTIMHSKRDIGNSWSTIRQELNIYYHSYNTTYE